MKKTLLSIFSLSSIIAFGQIADAGSAKCVGGISSFYHDTKDDLLYGIGTVSNAGGNAVNGIVAWNGTDFTAKGDKSLLTGNGINVAKGAVMTRHNDTLYVMGDDAVHPTESFPYYLLTYWDETANNWKSSTYGVFGITSGLISFNDTLFAYGNLSGGLDASEDQTKYTSLGSMAYWNGSRWIAVANTPNDWYGNPTSAQVMGGELYISNYKYKNGVWTKLFEAVDIKSMGLWNNKVVYGIETGNNDTNYVKTYDGSKLETVGTFNHNLTSITVVDGKLAVCGNFDEWAGQTLKEIALWDGTSWSDYDNFAGTINTIGGYHNQLLMTSTEGYGAIYRMSPDTAILGSIAVQGGALVVSVETADVISGASAYPNPTSGILNLGKVYDEARLYSLDGKIQIVLFGGVAQLQLDELKNGAYFLQTVSGDQINVQKIIKY